MLSLAYSFIQSFYFSSLNLSDSFLNGKKLSRVLPEQVKPSELSLYPSLQEHEKLPTLFSQVCWHPPFARAHSSLSIDQKSVFRLNVNPKIKNWKQWRCHSHFHLLFHRKYLTWKINGNDKKIVVTIQKTRFRIIWSVIWSKKMKWNYQIDGNNFIFDLPMHFFPVPSSW